jgi:radical SAM/Cys-rich protein
MALPAEKQIEILRGLQTSADGELKPFESRLPGGCLAPASLLTMQINVGKLCNQTCKHCHVDAGPTRKEIMTRSTMEDCIRALEIYEGFKIVDITGGAPEMNPNFRWLVEQARARGKHVMARCNLTIIEAHAKYSDLPEFYARHGVEVISSLPSFNAAVTDRQRGSHVYDKSVAALKRLNAVGYGHDPKLSLHLVYNPNGAFLPGDQAELEAEFKGRLLDEHGIVFNNLFTITNMPISRFLDYLSASGNLEAYMRRLNQQFNPAAIDTLMCRTMISVGWDGRLYDCDFNQMLELEVATDGVVDGAATGTTEALMTIATFDAEKLLQRNIIVGSHCYGCTAGAGSSCGGSLV